MEEKETIENLKVKMREIKSMSGLNSKNFRFKNWYASTLNLLRSLPSDYIQEVNDFRSLTFEDTKYHRGRKFITRSDNTKFREDLDSAVEILGKITARDVKGQEVKKTSKGPSPEREMAVNSLSEDIKTKKPERPPKKTESSGRSISEADKGKAIKAGPKKHESAKRGKSTAGEKSGS